MTDQLPLTIAQGRDTELLSEIWQRPFFLLVVVWSGFAFLMLLEHWLALDFRLADTLYRLQGNSWALQDHIILQQWLHLGGRTLSQSMGAVVLLSLFASLFSVSLQQWRRPLLFLFLAVAVSTLTVSMLKQLIPVECPWDLVRYGGELPFVSMLGQRSAWMPDTACFPAGHASAGYAWIAFYFFLVATRPRWRWFGLVIGFGLGLVFGIAQQIRGAHFFSHDLWALMICLTISIVLAAWLLPGRPR
ncbi:MAG: phosphatase PAP2 family protein [Pseudohongiella sp.]|nr:phosphatase PAP2 family protein [Pseudohongiella sp.]